MILCKTTSYTFFIGKFGSLNQKYRTQSLFEFNRKYYIDEKILNIILMAKHPQLSFGRGFTIIIFHPYGIILYFC